MKRLKTGKTLEKKSKYACKSSNEYAKDKILLVLGLKEKPESW